MSPRGRYGFAAMPATQAAALGADPAIAVEASLDINWRGVASP